MGIVEVFDLDGNLINTNPFQTVAQGTNSGITQVREEAIRDQVSWETFWNDHAGSGSSVPVIDFNSDMVIAVHLGTRPSSGYSANITQIVSGSGRFTVNYDEVVAGLGCGVLTVITYPFHIIKMAKTVNVPIFLKNVRVINCPP